MGVVIGLLEKIMTWCYSVCHNYGWAVVLFTFISKLVLLPVSVWVQKNSIKMVKMQPEINFMKVRYFGDRDRIADEESKIYREYGYNPFASMIPLLVQILLLMGLIEVIKEGIADPSISLDFYGINLGLVPATDGGWLVLSPILAALSAWLLSVAQNLANVLQSEQGKANKYITMGISVGLSLYLGWFVAVGVAIYWIASNLFAIAQQYILNWCINPKKYVDYERLEKSKEELRNLEELGKTQRKSVGREALKRERADYKRFFSVVNKKLVFYSEGSGFYKYFKGIIEYILENTNITVHYVTSDPEDQVFALSKANPQIRAYYIGEKRLITLMMKMDADVVVMTMPDLENYHIKRSYVRKDIEYIYIPHAMDSLNLTMRKGSMDHFDTVFCTGKHMKEECEKTEAVYGLKPRKLVEWGYSLFDEMRSDCVGLKKSVGEVPSILIAPSWQKDNIVDLCLEPLVDNLKGRGYRVIVRPHPQHVRLKPDRMEYLKERYSKDSDVEIQTDFSSNSTVFEADLLVTDWSGIAYEYAFATCRPVLFIDTPMKIMNEEYEKIGVTPINVWSRQVIGTQLAPDCMNQAYAKVSGLLEERSVYGDRIRQLVEEYVYNLDMSAEVGAKYIIGELQKKVMERKKA